MNNQIVDRITTKIISRLEKGEIVWRKPWKSLPLPTNYVSNQQYRGWNRVLLWLESEDKHYQSNYWLTFKQTKAAGGSVKKGEHATEIMYWDTLVKEVPENEWSDEQKQKYLDTKIRPTFKVFFVRSYWVFNYEQTTGVPDKEKAVVKHEPIKEAEAVIKGYKNRPEIVGSDKAWYSPVKDQVGIPAKERFEKVEEYYSTVFHELTHSTGHQTRINRDGVMKRNMFGSDDYSQEELVAEFGASFLSAEVGIDPVTIENSAAYIQNWLHALKDNKDTLFYAVGKAQKAADYILGKEVK